MYEDYDYPPPSQIRIFQNTIVENQQPTTHFKKKKSVIRDDHGCKRSPSCFECSETDCQWPK